MRLIIAEKPSLGRTIAQALGKKKQENGYIELSNGDCVTWLAGHFYEFADPDHYLSQNVPVPKNGQKSKWRAEDLPIIPSKWIRVLKNDKWVRGQHKVVLGLLKKASIVVNAGDPDREGQLLVDEWLEEVGNKKPVMRVWLQDLTDDGIRKAFEKMVDNEKMRPLRDSALARAKADWIIGMNATRAMTLAQGGKLLSIGRVQTPTLALIVQRDKEIESFVPKDYFEVYAYFLANDGRYRGKWKIPEDFLSVDGILLDERVAQACVDRVKKIGKGKVEKVETKRKKVPAPLPFSLSDLQKHLSRFGFGAKETLETVQKLYEAGVLTYPRTDCNYLESGKHQDAKDILGSLASAGFGEILDGADANRRSRAFDDSKVTAHTAIVPTKKMPENLSDKEKILYGEVVKRYVAQFHPDHEYDETTIMTRVGDDVFITTGQKVVVQGWKLVYRKDVDEEEKEADHLSVMVREGQVVDVDDAVVERKKTQPPKRFTEGTLIEAMSRAAKFIEDERYRKILRETDGIGTEATRAAVIETLKDRGYIEVRGKKKEIYSTEIGRKLIEIVPSDLSDVALTAVWEQALSLIAEGKYDAREFEKKQEGFIREIISKIEGTRGKMGLTNKVSRGNQAMESLGKCPVCHEGDVVETPKGYGCSRWRDGCKFVVWKEIAGRKMNIEEVEELLKNGKTKVLTGFRSKAGRHFSAALEWDGQENKVKFVFDN